MNRKETVVTTQGTTTIPSEIRVRCGIAEGTVLVWSERNGVIQIRKKPGARNDFQKHIRARAGKRDGKISGVELLKRTRP